MFRNKLGVLRWRVFSPPPNPQAGGPPPVGCPRLVIQYIRSYPPYLEAVSSIRNLSTPHAVVRGNPLNISLIAISIINCTHRASFPQHFLRILIGIILSAFLAENSGQSILSFTTRNKYFGNYARLFSRC
jgi:hypothetical protein